MRRERAEAAVKIGFIGVGTMGRPMLANLVKKGFVVTAYDIVPAALEAAAAEGAACADSPAEAAAAGDLVITMLPSSSHVEAAYLGPKGVGEGIAHGRLAVDMSTIDPTVSQMVARALGERGVRFLDAPVSGAVGRAIAGTLTIMAGGAAEDLEEARPALAAMGGTIVHVGAVGAGEIAGTAMVAVSEAFRIGAAFGVDPQVLTEVIANSSGATWVMQYGHPVPGINAEAASSHDYAAGFMTDLMAKDLGLALNAARNKRVPIAVAAAAQLVYRLASAHGLGRKDFSSVYQFLQTSPEDAPV
jgi:3-hydroxyisobutyrate dehydrogenase